ncbi:MAG: hypothetical protein ACRDZ8_00260, partial [Acidimicrobiales bacterium]
VLVATLVARLGLEALINATMRLGDRVGAALPGRKVLTLVHAMVAGGSHIDHADMLRSGATDGGGVGSSGDGALHAGHVPQGVHLRPSPPAGDSHR